MYIEPPSIQTASLTAMPRLSFSAIQKKYTKAVPAIAALVQKVAQIVFFLICSLPIIPITFRISLYCWSTKQILLPLEYVSKKEADKRFAQFHGDDYIGGKQKYAGGATSKNCYWMREKLKTLAKKNPDQRETLLPIIKNLTLFLNLAIEQEAIKLYSVLSSLTEKRKAKKNHVLAKKITKRIQALKPGESLLIPSGWAFREKRKRIGHAQAIFVKRQTDHSLQKLLIDTAGHLTSHRNLIRGKKKKPRFLEKIASKQEGDTDLNFYKKNFALNTGVEQSESKAIDAMKQAWHSSAGTSIASNEVNEEEWTTGQRSGSCALRIFPQFLFAHLPYQQAKTVKRQLLEMDIEEQCERMLTTPEKRALLSNALQHLNQIYTKHNIPKDQRKVTTLVEKRLKQSYKEDRCYSSETNRLWKIFPQMRQPQKNWGITWKKNKRGKHTCTIQGTTYTLASKQEITFSQGFDQFIVIEDASGKKKVVIPKGKIKKHDQSLVPQVRFSKPPQDFLLLDLTSNDALKPTNAGQELYLATLCLCMKRYEKCFFYLQQASSKNTEKIRYSREALTLNQQVDFYNPTELALGTCAILNHVYFNVVQKLAVLQLNCLHEAKDNIHEKTISYKNLKDLFKKKKKNDRTEKEKLEISLKELKTQLKEVKGLNLNGQRKKEATELIEELETLEEEFREVEGGTQKRKESPPYTEFTVETSRKRVPGSPGTPSVKRNASPVRS